MKKIGMIGVALAAAMTATCLTACVGEQEHYDMEESPFVMGIQTPDGVFNPFFSTSMYDSNIISWTQIGMLNTDKEGNIVCGENEMCAVKAYGVVYDENEDSGYKGTDAADYPGVTTYQFAIKNGIKFSDGEPLTIKDVLFNLYVYLDINYTGSSTIYSTKILGLEAYRSDNPEATEDTLSSFEETRRGEAQTRIDDLDSYVKTYGVLSGITSRPNIDWNDEGHKERAAQAEKDFFTVKEKFWEELNTDWNSITGGMEDYRKQAFEEPWQVFAWREDEANANEYLQKKSDGSLLKDADGNVLFDKDSAYVESLAADLAKELEDKGATAENRDELTKQWALSFIYNGFFPNGHDDTETPVLTQIKRVRYDKFNAILNYYATSETILTQFTAEAREAYFNKQAGDRKVKTISGIKTLRGNKVKDDKGDIALGEDCDILQIKIRGKDPKAIYNFSFLVAPLHYYSGTFEGKDYVADFNGVEASAPDADNTNRDVCFGLKPGSTEFMNSVINDPAKKVGLPVGAGPYMASRRNGGAATNKDDFMNLNRVYYERNPYFYTVLKGQDEEDTEEIRQKYNAKIKKMQYFVVPADQYITNLEAGELDFADPSASDENEKEVNKLKKIDSVKVKTAGYGYIGINPRYVPNIYVRRAIMMAMNTQTIFNDYYPHGLAEPIYRSMSTSNWAYDYLGDGKTSVYQTDDTNGVASWDGRYAFDANGEIIEAIVKAAGYTKGSDGVYQKSIPGFSNGVDRLDYTFTIAGSSTDHPAYKMLLDARKLLNDHGFAVKVTTSQTALSDLTTGKLAVWAAAWTSTVDPDMYQVYHMDSKATSVNNWGYPYIKKGKGTLYTKEYSIITELSNLIDQGRRDTDQTVRGPIYKEALDLVMELAVEFPTYQRVDLFAFNKSKLKRSTMPAEGDLGAYNSPLSRIWEIEYN